MAEPVVPEEVTEPEAPEETPEEAPEVEAEVEPEAEPEAEPEVEPEVEVPKVSRRENLRIQALVEKLKRVESVPSPVQGGMDYSKVLDADPETIERLVADRTQVANSAAESAMHRAESIQFHTRLEIDAPKIESKYPAFDKDSDKFNPTLANAVNQWYLSTVGFDPQTDTITNAKVRYSEFVEGIMELADEIAGDKNTSTAKNLAKQAAQTGLRPDGGSAKRLNLNKAPKDMTDEELAAVIAQAIPSK